MSARPAWGGRAWYRERARWVALLPYPCSRCGLPVYPWQPWDIDHPLGIRVSPVTAPAHRACNRKAGGQYGHQLRALGQQSRSW